MNSLPFFHLSGENSIMKKVLDGSHLEFFLIQADTYEVIYLNKTAIEKQGDNISGLPITISRIGTDYNFHTFKDIVLPLLSGSCDEVQLTTFHKNERGKLYPVEARITRNTTQGLDYFLLVAEDISDRQKLEREIKQMRVESKKVEFIFRQFVNHASQGMKEKVKKLPMLLRPDNDAAWAKNPDCMNKRVATYIQELESYIQDFTNFPDNIMGEPAMLRIDFNHILKKSLENMEFMTGFSRQKVVTEVNQEIKFFSDENRLQIVMNYLISNAVKFQNQTPGNSILKVSIHVIPQKAVIKIGHMGKGIDRNGHTQSFDKFCRMYSGNGETGLGLYIISEVIKKLRGKIEVFSSLGAGTEFLIEIPNKIARASVHKPVK